MRAIQLTGTELGFCGDLPDFEMPGLIKVEVLTAGICETDMQLRLGYMGFQGTLGHEFVGIATSGRYAGQRVVGEINCACGTCTVCQAGNPRHCPTRTVIGILNHDGAFADYLYVPEANLLPVPDSLPTDHAVFTEPVAAACRILEQITIDETTTVAVLGDGRLGNLCAQVLSTKTPQVTVVGKHDWKLQRLQALNISTMRLADVPPEQSADVVVDCTGSPTGFELALQLVQPCGTIILKTTVAAPQSLHLAPIVIDEVRVLGSRCGPFAPALELLTSGQVQVQELISARYPLEDAESAFCHAERPDTLKVLFDVADK